MLRRASLGLLAGSAIVYSLHQKNVETEQLKQTSKQHRHDLIAAINESVKYIERKRIERNIPGLVIGVSVDGEQIWADGFGLANVENAVPCDELTVMRIASISKSITAILVAKLIEEKKIDLDASIYTYLGDKFPKKYWDGRQVDITVRQLLSHFSGIRNYKKVNGEFEFYSQKFYSNTIEALNMFKDDELIANPGSKFEYTTLGYTLLTAVIEQVLADGEKFGDFIIKRCRKDFHMFSTYLDEPKAIIFNRANGYFLDNGQIQNVPFVDNSYKWAGGGLLSTVGDLLKFANIVLGCLNQKLNGQTAFLSEETIKQILSPIENSKITLSPEINEWTHYALGWGVSDSVKPNYQNGPKPKFNTVVFHSGGAVGAASMLLIIPELQLIVTVMCNLEKGSNVGTIAYRVAEIFSKYLNSKSNSIEVS